MTILLIVGIEIGIGLVIPGAIRWSNLSKIKDFKIYSGRMAFETQEQYSDFLRALENNNVNNVNIHNISSAILSSNLPIVVEFSANVKPDYNLNYGNCTKYGKDFYDWGSFLLCLFGVGFLGAGSLMLLIQYLISIGFITR